MKTFEELVTSLMTCVEAAAVSGEGLREDIPRRWEVLGDLIIFPGGYFKDERWLSVDYLGVVMRVFRVKQVALRRKIHGDNYRTPDLSLLTDTAGDVLFKDHGILYSFNVKKCMFSSGNGTERSRMGSMPAAGEVIVDMFAGIGYFTLPFLVHGGASLVHACEWNPDAVAALRSNLELNRVGGERCVIHEGDCVQLCPWHVADRVCLGLLPTSRHAWSTALRALRRDSGGWLHIHSLLNTRDYGASSHAVEKPVSPTSPTNQSVELPLSPSSPTNPSVELPVSPTSPTNPSVELPVSPTSPTNPSVDGDPGGVRKRSYNMWRREVRDDLTEMAGAEWEVDVKHIEWVKSYAPHTGHIVTDIHIYPKHNAVGN